MKDDRPLRKSDLDASHSVIAKTVSDFGAIVNKNNAEIIDFKRLVKDYIERADKKMDSQDEKISSQDKKIETLNEAKTTIFSSIKTTKFIGGLLITVIITMGGFIISTWSNGYNDRLDKIELDRKETLEKVLQMLNDKKNYLNYNQKETIKDIFANL